MKTSSILIALALLTVPCATLPYKIEIINSTDVDIKAQVKENSYGVCGRPGKEWRSAVSISKNGDIKTTNTYGTCRIDAIKIIYTDLLGNEQTKTFSVAKTGPSTWEITGQVNDPASFKVQKK